MAYVPPLNGGRINASITGNTAGAASVVSTGTVVFAGGNNITLSQNANSITISAANAPSGSINFSASNTSANLASVTFSNSNGLSFGLSAGAITGSYTVPTQSNQTLSFSAGSQSTLTAAGTFDARNYFLNGVGAAKVGFSQSSVFVSVPTQTVETQSIGMQSSTAGGGTGGTTGYATGGQLQYNFYAGSNITLSQSINGASGSLSLYGGAGGAGGGIALYDGAHSISSGTANIVTAGGITASITNQTLSLSVPQTSSVVGGGIVSLSTNGSSVTISAPAFSAGVSTFGNTSSNTGIITNQLVLVGGSNITLVQATNATGATVTINGTSGGGGGGGVAIAGGGTTYTSGTANFVTAGGAITIGSSVNAGSQTLNFSVPATSSLVGASGISISTNGSTISVFPTSISTFVNMIPGSTGSQTLGAFNAAAAGSVQFYPVSIVSNLAFDAVRVAFAASYSTNTNAGSQTISHSFGLYSRNVSTLSLISSNSMGYSFSNSSVSATASIPTATGTGGYTYNTVTASTTAQLQSFFGSNNVWHMVDLQFGGVMNLTPGMYWLAMNKQEATAGTNVGMSLGLAGNIMTAPNLMAPFGSATSAMTSVSSIKGPYLGFGPYNATSNAMPSSAAISSINQSMSIMPFMTFIST